MAAILDLSENRAFAMEGFSTVDKYGTNELISGKNPLLQFCPTSYVYLPDYSPQPVTHLPLVYVGP